MKKYQKLMLASGVATALAGLSMPSHAIIEGAAGEALLVPFVLYSNPNNAPLQLIGDFLEPSINTLIMVTTPSAVGKDTIPNYFTAPNTTPTNAGPPITEMPDPDLGEEFEFSAGLHLYFFNSKSVEEWNDDIPVSPDDMTLINWGDIVEKQRPALNGMKGYMVITNEKGKGGWAWRDAARFSMFGDAWMIWPTSIGLIDSKIPVLPMSDGKDVTDQAANTTNNVVHTSGGAIAQATPLSSGMRTNISNGNGLADYTLFDLTMSNRFLPTIHVIWVDENIGQANTAYVFNDQEDSCSMTLPIANELNVYWTSIPTLQPGQKCLINPINTTQCITDTANACRASTDPDFFYKIDGNPNTPVLNGAQDWDAYPQCWDGPNDLKQVQVPVDPIVPNLPWVDAALELCYPEGDLVFGPSQGIDDLLGLLRSDIFFPGFVRFQINEYVDNNTGMPESAAVAFSIQLQIDVFDAQRELLIDPAVLPTLLPFETALGHERGKFNEEL